MPPHPLLADPTPKPRNRLALVAHLLLAYAVLLFVGGIVFAALNGFSPEESWGDTVTSYFFPLVPLAFSAAGWLIARRQPRNGLGWISLAIGIAGLGPVFPAGYSHFALVTSARSLPFGLVSAWMEEWSWIVWAAAAGIFFVLLFPDGKLLSARWKPAVWLGAVAAALSFAAVAFKPGRLEFNPQVVNPFGLEGNEALLDLLSGGVILLVVAVLVAATSLVIRFMRSDGELRLQLKWLISAGTTVLLSHLASTVSTVGYAAALGPAQLGPAASPSTVTVVQGIATFTWILVPVCAGVAVLKYRLDGIDRLIRRVVAALCWAAIEVAGFAVTLLTLTLLLTPGVQPNLAASLGAAGLALVGVVPAWKAARRLADRAVLPQTLAPASTIG